MARSDATYGFSGENGFSALAQSHHHSADGFDSIARSDKDTGFQVDDTVIKLRYQQTLSDGIDHQIDWRSSVTKQRSQQTYVGLAEQDFRVDAHVRYGLTALDRFDSEHSATSLRYTMLLKSFDWSVALFSNRFERDWFKAHDMDIDPFGAGDYEGSSLSSVLNKANDVADADHARALAALQGVPGAGDATVRLKHNAREYASDGAQLRLSWDHGPHTLRAGMRVVEDQEDRLQYYEYSDQQDGQLSAPRDATEPKGGDNRLTDSRGMSAFVEETLAFGDWTARLGMRRESYRTTERRYTGGWARSGLADGFPKIKADRSATLFGAGIHWAFSDQLDLFAGLHQGFTPTSGDAEPEEANNLEIGLRYADERGLRIESVLFNSDYRNIVGECRNANQGAFSDCEPGQTFGGGAATIQGLELRASHRLELMDGLQLPLSVTFSKSTPNSTTPPARRLLGRRASRRRDTLPATAAAVAARRRGLAPAERRPAAHQLQRHLLGRRMRRIHPHRRLASLRPQPRLGFRRTRPADLPGRAQPQRRDGFDQPQPQQRRARATAEDRAVRPALPLPKLGGCAAGVPAPGGAGLAGADSWRAFPNVGSRAKHAAWRGNRAHGPLGGRSGGDSRPEPPVAGPSGGRQPPHPHDVQRQADQVPLAPRLGQSPDAEARKPVASLIQPFRASESHLRLAQRALPSGVSSLSAMRRVAGQVSGSAAGRLLPSRAGATQASTPRASSRTSSASLQ